MDKFDYKDLLIKYIAHVIECEGVDFITESDRGHLQILTDEEKAEIARLSEESVNR